MKCFISRILYTLFYFVVYISTSTLTADINNALAIQTLLKNYTRPITILEIGVSSLQYIFSTAQAYPGVHVGLLLDHARDMVAITKSKPYNNVIILNPQKMTPQSCQMFSRCEHFDVVIINDLYPFVKKAYENFLEPLLQLGDYTFIELEQKHSHLIKSDKKCTLLAHNNGKSLLLYAHPKNGLDIPRWTKKNIPINSTPRYGITSTFNEKFLHKFGCAHPIAWIPGINLKTFVMLRGLYPNDTIIRNQLLAMKHTIPYHNDLIIGNILIQGHKLIPIDFNDKRRNASMHKCLTKAINLFNGDHSRLKNPEKRIDQYSQEL